jgi:hypothetical protein
MSQITLYDQDVERAREGLAVIQAEIESLVARRNELMSTAWAELVAAGVDAHVVPLKAFPYIKGRHNADAEVLVRLLESWYVLPSGRYHDFDVYRVSAITRRRNVGPEATERGLTLDHGMHRVLLVDTDNVLIARVPGLEDDERSHRLAVGRLRTLARREQMRVRVRDLSVEIVDPMDTVVHTGTVLTAFAFLLGVEL